MSANLIAVDLGGTNMRVARFPEDTPRPDEIQKVPTHAEEGPDSVIQRLIETIGSILPEGDDSLRIGVAVAGPLDPRAGVIYGAPNLPGWHEVRLLDRLHDHFACPIAIGNDANLAGLGEWRYGAGQGSQDVIYLTISTGIGGGVISDGQLLLGADGIGAELGHVLIDPQGPPCGCGQRGHLEALASGTAIAREARAQLAEGADSSLHQVKGEISAVEVGEAAAAGDPLAQATIERAARYLGMGMAEFCHIFNPDVFVLGGGVSQLGDLLLGPLQESLEEHVMNPIYLQGLRIETAALGDDSGLVGAMVLAADL